MNQDLVIIYTPDSFIANPLKMIRDMFKDLYSSRELAWRLAIRDLSAQYRQTLLGFLWVLILPITNTVVWIFLGRSGVVSISLTNLTYPIFVFIGAMLWAIFMDAVNAPLQGTLAAKSMLAKVNFPREAIIGSGIYQTLFNAGIKLALILIVIIFFGIQPSWKMLMIPFGIISLILAGTTIGIMITPIGLLYNDIGKSLPLLLQFLMYITPVVFPIPKQGLAATMFLINPITPLIQTTREWISGETPELLFYFSIINLVAISLLFVGWIIYRLAMPILIERMSA